MGDGKEGGEMMKEYKNIELDTLLSDDMFHDVPIYNDDKQVAFHSNLGSLTVLTRMTGYGWIDTETGYRAPDGKFWLASGNFDVREQGCITVGEAIEAVKANANTCRGI